MLPRPNLTLPRHLSHPLDFCHSLTRVVGRCTTNDTPTTSVTQSISHLPIGSDAQDLHPAYEDIAIHWTRPAPSRYMQ